MPTYKYVKDENGPDSIFFLKKVISNQQTFEVNCYLNTALMTTYNLQLVDDKPYINPIIVTTGKVTAGTTLAVPDVNWNFDIHVNAGTGVGVIVSFNGDTDNVIYVAPGSNAIIARYVSGRAIRTITTTLDGSGTYSLYCIRVEQYTPTEQPGL